MPTTRTPCPFCPESVYVLLQTCPHCGRRARTSPAAIEKGTLEAHRLIIWHRNPELAPPEFWYPPINPHTGECSPAYHQGRHDAPAEGERMHDIPPERRTRPLGVEEAARAMGFEGTADAVSRRLRRRINAGKIKVKELSDQALVFDLNDFPAEQQAKLKVKRRATDN